MLFNSFEYFVFFSFFAAIYFFAPIGWGSMKLLTVIAGYVFYAYPNPPYAILLAATSLFGWWSGNTLLWSDRLAVRRATVTLGVIANLGVLVFFKYSGFIAENLNTVASFVGLGSPFKPPPIVLPVGISFFVFENISFLIDRYRRTFTSKVGLVDYSLYISFFPHLLSGPIVRAADFVPQLAARPQIGPRDLQVGAAFVTTGLFLKTFASDAIFAPVSDAIFDTRSPLDLFGAWTGVLAFSGQIYCDFSGYTLAAIGFARILGISLCLNFDSPYAAYGFSDFWRRWHISLSSWLRDYLYVPLGGNRRGELRTYFNLMVTMVLGGIWHGASWQFAIWGFLHGIFLVGQRLLARSPIRLDRFSSIAVTFTLVTLAWIPFRAKSFDRMANIFRGVFFGGGEPQAKSSIQFGLALVALASVLIFHFLSREKGFEAYWLDIPSRRRSALLAAMWLIILMEPGVARVFIYFQF